MNDEYLYYINGHMHEKKLFDFDVEESCIFDIHSYITKKPKNKNELVKLYLAGWTIMMKHKERLF